MPMTYDSAFADLANMIVVPVTDPAYLEAFGNIITDAEQRIYRELDLIDTIVRAYGPLTANNRNFTLPTSLGSFRVVEQMNVITPSSVTNPELGTRNPLLPVAKEYLDAVYPSVAGAGIPSLMAPITSQSWVLGAWPDDTYTVEVVGTIRPAPMSPTNQTTLLTDLLPDVLMAAMLVFAAGYQLNFSAGADNPQAGVTWESHVSKLLESARVEEFRKRFGSQAWSSKQPDPIVTPPRT